MKKEVVASIAISVAVACAIGFISLYPTLFSDQLSREEFLISVLISENSDRLTKSSMKMQEAVLIQQNLTQTLLLSEVLYPELNNTELFYEVYLPKYNETIGLINEVNTLTKDYENFSNALANEMANYEKKSISSINVLAFGIIMIIGILYVVFIITMYTTRKKKRLVCPSCNSSNIRERTTKTPKYTCNNCKREFDKPEEKIT